MATGKVKWFNNAKGYGFVIAEAGGEDLFVHYSSIQMDGYKTLKAGQDVEFDIEQGPKGLHAVNIRSFDTGSVKVSNPIHERRVSDGERPGKPVFSASVRTEYAESR
jgi:cold shock protein